MDLLHSAQGNYVSPTLPAAPGDAAGAISQAIGATKRRSWADTGKHMGKNATAYSYASKFRLANPGSIAFQ